MPPPPPLLAEIHRVGSVMLVKRVTAAKDPCLLPVSNSAKENTKSHSPPASWGHPRQRDSEGAAKLENKNARSASLSCPHFPGA